MEYVHVTKDNLEEEHTIKKRDSQDETPGF